MLLGLFRRLAPTRPCTPERQEGAHGRLIGGLGVMGDAILCLRCGRERYDENWSREEIGRQEQVSKETHAEVKAARGLPRGLDTLAAKPDPEFDAWFSRGTLPSWWLPGRASR